MGVPGCTGTREGARWCTDDPALRTSRTSFTTSIDDTARLEAGTVMLDAFHRALQQRSRK